MVLAARILAIILLAFTVAHAIGCYHPMSPRHLPHRALTELSNFGQGHNPASHQCPPGTVQIDVEDLFLECYRGNLNVQNH